MSAPQLNSEMHTAGSLLLGEVAFVCLLLVASIGCRSGQPVQTDQSYCPPEEMMDVAVAESESRHITLAQFEQPEILPAPREVVVADADALTLADLETMAFGNNPTLAAAAARIEAAYGKQVQAGLYPNPVAGYHATEVGNEGSAGAQGGFVSQRFITGGKLGLDQAIAGQEVEEAQFRLQAQEQRVLSDVRLRYYDALVAQRRVELTEELARIGDELVSATTKLLKGRLATDNDLLQADIRAEESRILLDNARNQHEEAWRRLSAVVGLREMRIAHLVGELDKDLPHFQWQACYAMAVGANPELNAAFARVERARIAMVRAEKEPIPNIDVSVSVRHADLSGDEIVNVQAGIPLPIFNKNQGNIQAAEAEWALANHELQRIELDLQDRLAVSYRRYADARQQVDRYGQRIIPKAKKSLRLVTGGYEKGEVEYLTLLTAQQTYYQVNLSYLDALRELWTATAVLDGQLLSGSLATRQ